MDQSTLKQRIIEWFKARIETHPQSLQPGKLRPAFPSEVFNSESLANIDPDYLQMKKLEALWGIPFQASIYHCASVQPSASLGGIVAIYEDGVIFWLDDHSSDEGFQEFIRREQLPFDYPYQLATILLETRFHYLSVGFRRKVVGRQKDIPLDEPVIVQKTIQDDVYMQNYYAEKTQNLVAIAQQLHEPRIIAEENGYNLRFFAWTHVYGSIYQFSVYILQDGTFSWQGERIANDIGKAFVPH